MNSSPFYSSPSASCASSAASMSSFSSDSSFKKSKSPENLKATNALLKNNENLEEKKNNKEIFHNQNIFVDNYNNKNFFINSNNNESPSMAILARIKKLQHETSREENFRFASSTLNNFDNFANMIMIHHEATDETSLIHQVGDVVEDDANVESIAASLKAKIEILIKSFVDPKNSSNIKSVSSNSTFNSMPNSAFKSTSANVSDLSQVGLKYVSPTQFDESFISSLFSILFACNHKSKFFF
jgi:hypothetical protein